MFKKFATAEITGVKSSLERLGRTASLEHFSDYSDYRTDDGYIYVRVRAISSRVNKNNDGWPADELSKSYRTFLGKPNFIDHHNHDPERARGVVVDAQLHVDDPNKTSALDPYYASAPAEHLPPTWVELLIETDAKSFPKLAKAIANGNIDSVSMGCNVERSKCSHCGNWASTPDDYCQHIRNKGAEYDYYRDGQKTSKKSYEDCYDIGFFEISYVFDPADETALFLEKPRTSKIASDDQPDTDEPSYGTSGHEVCHNCGHEFEAHYHDGSFTCPECGSKHSISEHESSVHTACESCGCGAKCDTEKGCDCGNCSTCADKDKSVYDGGFQSKVTEAVAAYAKTGSYLARKMADAHFYDDSKRFECQECGTKFNGSMEETLECPKCHSDLLHVEDDDDSKESHRTADTEKLPQAEMTVAPEKVDTLRQEQVCPICGSMMEDGICEVCNFEEPPEGFGNPDLTKAQDTDDMQQQQGIEAEDAQQDSMQVQQQQEQGQMMPQQQPAQPGQPVAASYIGATTGAVSSEHTAADLQGGRVNTKEKPLLPATRQTTDNPRQQKTVKDSVRPVESNNNKETMSDTTRTADTNSGEELAGGKRVTLEGVGGVAGEENPDGHKTVSVDGVGGVVADDGSGEHVDLDKGLLEEVGGPTSTWGKGQGDSLGQQSPVSEKSESVLGKHIEFLAADTVEGDLATSGGKVMDLDGGLKEEVGERTKTWGGDSFHLTDPVTTEAYPTEGEVTSDGGVNPGKAPFPASDEGVESVSEHSQGGSDEKLGAVRAHFMAALKLAEAEIALGITDEDAKYDRIAELENEAPQSVKARLDTVGRVKTAGLGKKAAGVTRPKPSFQTTASTEPLRQVEAGVDDEAEGIFS